MNEKITGITIGLAIGALLALIQIKTIGITAAIALPEWFNNLLNSNSKSSLMMLWKIIVVQFVGAGIPALILTFATLKLIPFGKYWKVPGIIIGALATLFIFYVSPNRLSLQIAHHLYEVMLILCVLSMAYFVYRKQNA